MRSRRFVSVLALSCLAGACTTTASMNSSATVQPSSALALVEPEPVAVPEPVKVIIPTSVEVSGKEPGFLLTHFGDPDLKRSEMGAQFWTYAHQRCSVYFILYEEGGGDFTVSHVEVERHVADGRTLQVQIDACLSDIAYAFQAPELEGDAGS